MAGALTWFPQGAVRVALAEFLPPTHFLQAVFVSTSRTLENVRRCLQGSCRLWVTNVQEGMHATNLFPASLRILLSASKTSRTLRNQAGSPILLGHITLSRCEEEEVARSLSRVLGASGWQSCKVFEGRIAMYITGWRAVHKQKFSVCSRH